MSNSGIKNRLNSILKRRWKFERYNGNFVWRWQPIEMRDSIRWQTKRTESYSIHNNGTFFSLISLFFFLPLFCYSKFLPCSCSNNVCNYIFFRWILLFLVFFSLSLRLLPHEPSTLTTPSIYPISFRTPIHFANGTSNQRWPTTCNTIQPPQQTRAEKNILCIILDILHKSARGLKWN